MKRILGMALLLLAISFPAFADMTSRATLGGLSTSTGLYDCVVDVNGNLVCQGSATFGGNLLAMGAANGGSVSQVESVAALPLSYSVVLIPLINSVGAVYTLANGYPGQEITFTEVGGVVGSDTARITPATKTGFNYAALTGTTQSVTLSYINSSIGWVITGNAGATIA